MKMKNKTGKRIFNLGEKFGPHERIRRYVGDGKETQDATISRLVKNEEIKVPARTKGNSVRSCIVCLINVSVL